MSTQSEFSLIETYFTDLTASRDDVYLGIGDDCALLTCPDGHVVAVSIDTLVAGIHFFADVEPDHRLAGCRQASPGLVHR